MVEHARAVAWSLSRRRLLRGAAHAFALSGIGVLAACGGAASVGTAPVSSSASSVGTASSARPATSSAARSATASSTAAIRATSTTTSAAPKPATSVAAAGVTVTVTSWLTDQPMKEAYAHLIAAYAKVQPKVKVVQQPIAGNYYTKLTTQFAGGTPPDLAESNWGDSQAWGQNKAIVPLDQYLRQDKIPIADYVQVAQELGRWPQGTGSYYAWYTMFATSPLFYNTALFQAAGVAPPDESWTWQTLLENAQKLTKASGDLSSDVYGFNPDYFTRTMLYSYGWDYVTPDLSKSLLDSTESIDAMQFWQDLLYKYKVAPSNSGTFAKGLQFGPFSTKRLGMAIDGSYQIERYRTVQGLDWDIAIPPSGPKGRIAVVKGAPGHSLPAQSPHPKEAWAFLSWWTRNQTPDLVVLPGNLPSKLTALSGWATQQKQSNPTPANIQRVYDIATKYGKPVQVLPNNDAVKKPYYTERGNMLANKEDARTAMTKAAPAMMALLKQALANSKS